MNQNKQLTIPSSITQDPNSFEILRVWVATNGQHVSLRSGIWEDPAAWGIMLADLARHVANAYRENNGFDESKTLQRIKAGFEAEYSSPTDRPGGQLV